MNKHFVLNLFSILLISQRFYCFPIIGDRNDTNDTPLEIRVLQNPDLFGGDIMGIDINSYNNRNALPDANKLWPMGRIPFVLDGDQAGHKTEITVAMNQYHEKTCIRFVERTDEYDYIHIAVQHGCYSYVGRTGGKQLVSLAEGCHSVGTIVHELGHAVGFYHEHQRSDRDTYLNIYTEHIDPLYKAQFTALNKEDNKILVKFDYNSVMLYGPLTFSKDHQPTMGPKDKDATMLEVFQKYGLSDIDIKAINLLYEC